MSIRGVTIAVLVTPVLVLGSIPVSAKPTPNVTAEGNGSRATTRLNMGDQNTEPDPLPAAKPGPVSYPRVTRSVSPNCVTEGLVSGVLCGVPCEQGQIQYVVTTQRVEAEGAVPQVTEDVECGLPDQSVESLAIAEFYQTQVKVPAPGMHPPDGRTLVNFPNVLATSFTGYEQNTDITAAKVRLKFTPIKYVWNFSEGKPLTTTNPGKPYDPELTDRLDQIEDQYPITHRFTDTGNATISLTVIINGQFSVNGGAWQPITGSIQATSPNVNITIYEARGELILPPRS